MKIKILTFTKKIFQSLQIYLSIKQKVEKNLKIVIKKLKIIKKKPRNKPKKIKNFYKKLDIKLNLNIENLLWLSLIQTKLSKIVCKLYLQKIYFYYSFKLFCFALAKKMSF